MFCDNCSKFALLPRHHMCINCGRFCSYKEEKWCNYCATIKNICSVCGKPIKTNDNIAQDLKEQIDKIHGGFHGGGGCKTCGGRR